MGLRVRIPEQVLELDVVPEELVPPTRTSSTRSSTSSTAKCPKCGKTFKGLHGVEVHLRRSHPSEE